MADGFKLNLAGWTTWPLLRLGATALKWVDLHVNTAPQPVSLLDPLVREIASLRDFNEFVRGRWVQRVQVLLAPFHNVNLTVLWQHFVNLVKWMVLAFPIISILLCESEAASICCHSAGIFCIAWHFTMKRRLLKQDVWFVLHESNVTRKGQQLVLLSCAEFVTELRSAFCADLRLLMSRIFDSAEYRYVSVQYFFAGVRAS